MLKNIFTPCTVLLKNKKITSLIMLADLVFFLSFTAVFYALQERLSTLFLGLSELFASAGAPTGVGEEAAKEFLSRFPVSTFIVQFAELIELFAILVGAGVLFWIVFEGIAWRKTYQLAGKIIPETRFFARFSAATLFWCIVFLVMFIIAVKTSSAQLMNIFPVLQSVVKIFFGAVFGLLTYLGFVSYCLLDAPLKEMAKKTFGIGFRKFVKLFTLFVLILIIIYVALWMVKNSLVIAFWLPLVLFFVLFLPVVALGRLLFLNGVNK